MWSVGNAGPASWFVELLFFFFQFAYHLLHLPLLTPEGLRGDFDLNRKSRVVRLRISSSLNSAGKTLAPCLDSQTGFTGGSGLQEPWFDLKGVRAFVKSRSLVLWGSDTGWDWSQEGIIYFNENKSDDDYTRIPFSGSNFPYADAHGSICRLPLWLIPKCDPTDWCNSVLGIYFKL